jgi:lipoate-protein ligase A
MANLKSEISDFQFEISDSKSQIVGWNILDTGAATGSYNMAHDLELLERHAAGELDRPILRFYSWAPPAVSVGRHQRPESFLDLDACRELGIDVVRRPTGGGAILHEHEVTFSVIARYEFLGCSSVIAVFRLLGGAIAEGLRVLGIEARLVERPEAPAALFRNQPLCFAVKAACDIEVDGRKLVGCAQLRRDGAVLQQNSLPLRIDREKCRRVFQGKEPNDCTDIESVLSRTVCPSDVIAALTDSFRSHLDWRQQR